MGNVFGSEAEAESAAEAEQNNYMRIFNYLNKILPKLNAEHGDIDEEDISDIVGIIRTKFEESSDPVEFTNLLELEIIRQITFLKENGYCPIPFPSDDDIKASIQASMLDGIVDPLLVKFNVENEYKAIINPTKFAELYNQVVRPDSGIRLETPEDVAESVVESVTISGYPKIYPTIDVPEPRPYVRSYPKAKKSVRFNPTVEERFYTDEIPEEAREYPSFHPGAAKYSPYPEDSAKSFVRVDERRFVPEGTPKSMIAFIPPISEAVKVEVVKRCIRGYRKSPITGMCIYKKGIKRKSYYRKRKTPRTKPYQPCKPGWTRSRKSNRCRIYTWA